MSAPAVQTAPIVELGPLMILAIHLFRSKEALYLICGHHLVILLSANAGSNAEIMRIIGQVPRFTRECQENRSVILGSSLSTPAMVAG